MGSVTRVIVLDDGSPADVVGFRALGVVIDSLMDVPDAAWRVVGGWMVRAWVEGSAVGAARPTVDVDVALLASRGGGKVEEVPQRLRDAGLLPTDEPFRLRGPDDLLVDLLVPPGASRADPPRLGTHIVFEARGSRFGFEMPPEPVSVRLDDDRLGFPTVRLAAALVLKAVVLGVARPGRTEVDAVDVARLLSVVRDGPAEAISDLRSHSRRRDVREGLQRLATFFGSGEDPGAVLVARETDDATALTAVADARWLLGQARST